MDSLQTHLKKSLERLECHFTWNLRVNEDILETLRGIRDRGGCAWEGHLFNLLAYAVYHISKSTEEALTYLQKAEVILKQEAEGRGPRLLVNQANLAWMHYHLGELPESEAYLEKVAQLQKDFPAPPGCELHPEVYGEKGWTQMKFGYDFKKKAIANFEMALKGEPNRKEWNVGLALAKYRAHFEGGDEKVKEEITELLKCAKRMDPDNLCISSLYLVALGKLDRKTDETMKEAYHVIKNIKPYDDGFKDIFHFFRFYGSPDKNIEMAEQFVKDYPREKAAKLQLAVCYRNKVIKSRGSIDQGLLRKAIEIYEEVTELMPSYIRSALNLAELYTTSKNIERAELIYENLLGKEEDLEPKDLQLLCVRYAKFLHRYKKLSSKYVDYHMKAVEIDVDTYEKKGSIKILEEIASDHSNPRYREIGNFLSTFKNRESSN